uniref:GDNF domain-containing protein n=1 Tax=Dracunculus medinensis TaxID=318479 RepID=A0A0N4UAY8_DRAME
LEISYLAVNRITNTCQPQCRNAVLNLYQNRLGRTLLRTDVSCLPARHELELCNLLPNKMPTYCSLTKLICEADLQCNAKWGIFMSECEAEAENGRCNKRCSDRLNDTIETFHGTALSSCTCNENDDELCKILRKTVQLCLKVFLTICDENGTIKKMPSMQFAFVFIQFVVLFTIRI